MNQSLKFLNQINGSMCSEELVKELQPLYNTKCKAWRKFCYDVEGFDPLQSWRFVPGEGQIESDQLSRHTAGSCDLICTHAR